jgi:hypothetical protein
MFGHASIAEAPFAGVGGIVLFGVADMNALATSSSIGVGTLVGTVSLNGNFTQTSTSMFISAGASIDANVNFTQTTENIKIVNFTDVTLSSTFTQSANSIMIGSGVATTNLNMTQTSSGDLLYENINAGATQEEYTTISPSGTETWTTVNPSGSETWTEIEA